MVPLNLISTSSSAWKGSSPGLSREEAGRGSGSGKRTRRRPPPPWLPWLPLAAWAQELDTHYLMAGMLMEWRMEALLLGSMAGAEKESYLEAARRPCSGRELPPLPARLKKAPATTKKPCEAALTQGKLDPRWSTRGPGSVTPLRGAETVELRGPKPGRDQHFGAASCQVSSRAFQQAKEKPPGQGRTVKSWLFWPGFQTSKLEERWCCLREQSRPLEGCSGGGQTGSHTPGAERGLSRK